MTCSHCGDRHVFTDRFIDVGFGQIRLPGYCCQEAQDEDAAIEAMADAADAEADMAEALARGEVDVGDPEQIVRDAMEVEG